MEGISSTGASFASGAPFQSFPFRRQGLSRMQSVDYEEEMALALAISASEAEQDARHRGQQSGQADDRSSKKRQEEEDRDFAYALQLQSEDDGLAPVGRSTPSGAGQPSAPPIGYPFDPLAGGSRGVASGRHSIPDTGAATNSSLPSNSPDELLDNHHCAGCNRWIGFKPYTTALGKKWHRGCFRCASCQKGIDGKYIPKDGEPYHPECHRELFQDRCKVCGEHLPMVGNRISWSEHPFWQQKYCGKHNQDGTPRCTACERLKGKGENWVSLQDGRQLCSSCVETIVVDTQDCQPLYTEILETYRQLGLPLPSRPPLMLVDQQALNECDAHEGNHHGAPQSQTRGMTLAEEYRSIRTVRKSSGWSVHPELVPIERRHCSVTAILVLYGLPRLLTGSILAHEVMHAWLKLNNIMQLSQDVEEGLCQLMALIWLERQDQQGPNEKRLGSFVGHQIRTNPTLVYGDGFRAAHASFQQYGLKAVIDHVRETGQLPIPVTRG